MIGEDSSDVDDAALEDSDMELDDDFHHKEITMDAGYLLNIETFVFIRCSMFICQTMCRQSSS